MSSPGAEQPTHFWPHRWAVCLACATFPLIWVGGLVTTTDAGMAVPDWPSTYGYNLFLYPWQTWLFGPWDMFIEHGHRLLGATVGLLTVGLLISLWRFENRNWVKQLGIFSLIFVIAQGVLGGMRVLFDERLLALSHGCTGPLFFALTVCLAVVTSHGWRTGDAARTTIRPASRIRGETGCSRRTDVSLSLDALAIINCGLVYAQIILGALLRHVPVVAEPASFATVVQCHLLCAVLIVLASCALVWTVMRSFSRAPRLRTLAIVIVVLVLAQVMLGAATWAVKYSVAQWITDASAWAGYTIQAGGWLQIHVITAHVAAGSLLLAASVVLAVYCLRIVPVGVNATRHVTPRVGVAV